MSKIFDSSVTPRQVAEIKRAEATVKALLEWDLSQDTVDVALQIQELLDEVRANHKLPPDVEMSEVDGSERSEASQRVSVGGPGDEPDRPIEIDLSDSAYSD